MTDPGGLYRYWLLRRWRASEPMVLWVLDRPGRPAAGRSSTDRAVTRLAAWSHQLGFGGFLAVALYPVCAGSAAEFQAWRRAMRPSATEIGEWRAGVRDLNDLDGWKHVIAAARQAGIMSRRLHCRTRVAAWGRLDDISRDDLDLWLAEFGGHAPNQCLGVSDNGDPLHLTTRGASRLSDLKLRRFNYPIGIGRLPVEQRLADADA